MMQFVPDARKAANENKQIDLTIPPSLPAGADGPKSSTDRCSLTERARIELNSPSTQSWEI